MAAHKRAEDDLKTAVDFFFNRINAMQDGFPVLDKEGRQLDVNPAFCAMTGFSGKI